ncbi:hypothetical protein MKW92_039923 [Papaver armeniacum]|nr:hypothetical protein MKW92_039923 [Papaver armeniacum]
MNFREVVDISSDDEGPAYASSSFPPAPVTRQFWKAGIYECVRAPEAAGVQNEQNHLRVHPKFLHSNATSHKWAFGAVAELLDNAVDEIRNGCTFVMVDKIKNPRDGSPALLIQDDGGGMDPEALRRCMSFGFSDKKLNSIGQYGNGFKTSSMRLGADVLSKIIYVSCYIPLAIASIYYFNDIGKHGTKIIIYNLWFTDDGEMELDFESNVKDIQLPGAPKISKKASLKALCQQHLANKLRYSLREYSSMLYLRLPEHFRIILRGQDVKRRNVADDLKILKYISYRPHRGPNSEGSNYNWVPEGCPKLNIQGFCVYHKNRLIMPFWNVVSQNDKGRGVAGALEVNFIQPTHNKQEFEKTAIFQRLETRLKEITLEYWDKHCELIGYQQCKKKPSTSKSPPVSETFNAQNSGKRVVCLQRKERDHITEPETKKSRQTWLEMQLIEHPIGKNGARRIAMQENERLRARCLEFEKSEEELNLKVYLVEELKTELEEVDSEYYKLLAEFVAMGGTLMECL